MSGGVPRYVTLRYPDYRIDWDEVRRAVTPRTRVIVLNTPHNPTGMVWTRATCASSRRVLEHTDAIVVSDEVYEHVRLRRRAAREPRAVSRDCRRARSSSARSARPITPPAGRWGTARRRAPLIAEILRVRQWVTFAVNGAVQMAYADAVTRDPARATT